jgi:mannose-6-phosphate isomerase-like protein (cupin superfamily)
MSEKYQALRLVINNGRSSAVPSSPLWERMEDMATAGHLPAFGHQYYCDYPKSFAKTRHYHGRLIYVLSGDLRVDLNVESLRVGAKSAIWIPAWLSHGLHVTEKTMFNAVYVHTLLMPYLPISARRFGASPLLEQITNALAEVPMGAKITKRSRLLSAVMIDEINAAEVTVC